jgi:hypothetical protein
VRCWSRSGLQPWRRSWCCRLSDRENKVVNNYYSRDGFAYFDDFQTRYSSLECLIRKAHFHLKKSKSCRLDYLPTYVCSKSPQMDFEEFILGFWKHTVEVWGPFLTSPLGANFDPQGQTLSLPLWVCPPGVKLWLHGNWSTDNCSTDNWSTDNWSTIFLSTDNWSTNNWSTWLG